MCQNYKNSAIILIKCKSNCISKFKKELVKIKSDSNIIVRCMMTICGLFDYTIVLTGKNIDNIENFIICNLANNKDVVDTQTILGTFITHKCN